MGEQNLLRLLVEKAPESGWLSVSLIFLGWLVSSAVTVAIGWLTFRNKRREVEGYQTRDLMEAQRELVNELREDNRQQNEAIRALTRELTGQRTEYEHKLSALRDTMRERVKRREQRIRELCVTLRDNGIEVPEPIHDD